MTMTITRERDVIVDCRQYLPVSFGVCSVKNYSQLHIITRKSSSIIIGKVNYFIIISQSTKFTNRECELDKPYIIHTYMILTVYGMISHHVFLSVWM